MEGSKKILVVDDEVIIRKMFKLELEELSFEVETAASVSEAVSLLDDSFDVVLADIKMPGRDGLSLLDYIKEKYPSVKPIIMTGYSSEYPPKLCLSKGADAYLAKPFETKDLVAKIIQV